MSESNGAQFKMTELMYLIYTYTHTHTHTHTHIYIYIYIHIIRHQDQP